MNNKMNKLQQNFDVLRTIESNSKISQRSMAKKLGISLGKLNYCLKELKKKGLVKMKNFYKKEDRLSYIQYVLTPKGIYLRTQLTISFMKRKLEEYDQLKRELEENQK